MTFKLICSWLHDSANRNYAVGNFRDSLWPLFISFITPHTSSSFIRLHLILKPFKSWSLRHVLIQIMFLAISNIFLVTMLILAGIIPNIAILEFFIQLDTMFLIITISVLVVSPAVVLKIIDILMTFKYCFFRHWISILSMFLS